MPELHLAESIITSLSAQEPWPDNVKLFQPYEVEQILLPDNASCLAVQAFLKMCNLPFEVEMRWNAEFMSPSGRVPFIKCGAFVVPELEPIVQFVANKGVSLCGQLSMEEKAEMRAYMSLITNVLVNAELYISWIDNETFNAVTKIRNSSVYPWPLGWLQTRSKRNAVSKRLRALHWGDKTLEQVMADVDQCCNSLSQRLGDKDYFFGSTPSQLDALVFGHMRALLSAKGPKAGLMLKPITASLLNHVVRIVSATGMMLTPQEEYLLTQACQVLNRRLSPESRCWEQSAGIKRSRLCVRNVSGENVCNKRGALDAYGFKPFASKQVKMLTSKDGGVTCAFKNDLIKIHSTTTFKMETNYNFVDEIIEDLLEKVEEIAFDRTDDFEIVYPNDGKCASPSQKISGFLDTIDENDGLETTLTDFDVNLIHIEGDGKRNDNIDRSIYDDMKDNIIEIDTKMNDVIDSDGVVNDKHLEAISEEKYNSVGSIITGPSDNKYPKEFLSVTSSAETLSKASEQTCGTNSEMLATPISSGSKCTLKMPSDEGISVESLLKYLRQRNAEYNGFRPSMAVDTN